uniref:Uncharacterized protein n=1 Tax=Mesocestoides corti TaxID=53468 RepID=A0A5K3EFT4_MESCO
MAHWRRRRQRRRQGESRPLLSVLMQERHSSDSSFLEVEEGTVKGEAEHDEPNLNASMALLGHSVSEPSMASASSSILRRMLSAVGSFILPSSSQEQVIVAEVDRSFAESMDIIRSIASSLDLPAHLPESFYARLPFRRSGSDNHLKPLMEELELLTFYSKFTPFLKSISPSNVSLDLLQHTVSKLENTAVFLLASCFQMDALEAATSDLDLLMCLDVPAVRDLTPFPSFKPKDHLIKFAYCQYQFASFLANLSVVPEAVAALSHP